MTFVTKTKITDHLAEAEHVSEADSTHNGVDANPTGEIPATTDCKVGSTTGCTDTGMAKATPPSQFPSFRSFQPEGQSEDSSDSASRAAAQRLLNSPRFFNHFLQAVRRRGLIGEERNALILYLAACSRVLARPLNDIVKGHSSTGKNYLVRTVLSLCPKSSYREISSSSKTAWEYSADSYKHKIVFVLERNSGSGPILPIRMLISEGKLIREVTVHRKGDPTPSKKTFVANGPIAAISTTTKNVLEIDDETRHLSLWMDESAEQTKRIMQSYGRPIEPLSTAEVSAWWAIQELLDARIDISIQLPTWFDDVAATMVDAEHNVALRRYYPLFCEACKTIALLRSLGNINNEGLVEVDFADFAVAQILLDEVIFQSLHHQADETLQAAQCIRSLTATTGEAAHIKQIALALQIDYKRAAERIQQAEKAGLIQRVNKPEFRNGKRFAAISPHRLLPDPATLYRTLRFN